MHCNDCNGKDRIIKKLEDQIYDLEKEKRDLETNIQDSDREICQLSDRYDQLNEDFTALSNEYYQSETAWENTLEQLEEDIVSTYEIYILDLIEANPSLALTSKHEKVRRLAEKLIKQSSG